MRLGHCSAHQFTQESLQDAAEREREGGREGGREGDIPRNLGICTICSTVL